MLKTFSRFGMAVLAAVSLLSSAGWVRAQDEDDYRLELDFGYRWKSGFEGSEDLYRTQLDLNQGLRLFSGNLFYAPADGKDGYFDRLEFQFAGVGGEPYTTARVRAMKNGLYDFNFFVQDFDYFSSIPSFANPHFEKGLFDSWHSQDTSLRTGGFDLVFTPGKRISPFISYQRSSRSGRVRTTVSGDGDEFRLDSDLDIHADDLRGGLVFTFTNGSVRVEQGGRWYNDDTTFTGSAQEGYLPGVYVGQEKLYLDSYQGLNRNYSRVIPYSVANTVYQPLGNLVLRGKVSYSMADTRTNFFDDMQGNFYSFEKDSEGKAWKGFYSGLEETSSGKAKYPNILGDVSAEWAPTRWLQVTERFRTNRMHVSGSALLRSLRSDLRVAGTLDMVVDYPTTVPYGFFLGLNVDIQELEGEVFVRPDLSLRLGHRYERREYEAGANFDNRRNLVIAGVTYRRSARNRIDVDYEAGSTDRAIMRTDAVDVKRLRVRGRMSPFEALQIRGSATLFDHNNDVIDYFFEDRNVSLEFTYAPCSRLSLSGQWERTQVDTEIPYQLPQTYEIDRFAFSELGDYGNLYVSLALIRNAQLSLGYSVWGNRGTMALDYHQPFAKLEVPLGEHLVAYGQWNYYDYFEKVETFPQAYRTHLATMGLRVALDK